MSILQMLQWKRSRGRQYVFFQSHPGFAFGSENVTKEFYDNIMCKEVGDALHLVVERGQRWKCPTYREGEFRGSPPMYRQPEGNIWRLLERLESMGSVEGAPHTREVNWWTDHTVQASSSSASGR